MDRQGSFFYVLDAFIASIIIILALVALFSQFLAPPGINQPFYSAEDLLSLAASTQVRNIDDSLVRQWSTDGSINDTSRSALEQLALFATLDRNAAGNNVALWTHTTQFAQLLAKAVPPTVNVQILVYGQVVYGISATQNAADTLHLAKRLVLLRKEVGDTYPPVNVEVRTWQ